MLLSDAGQTVPKIAALFGVRTRTIYTWMNGWKRFRKNLKKEQDEQQYRRKLLLMSERGSTNRIRKQWAEDVNLALGKANLNARVEHQARWSYAIYCSPNARIIGSRYVL